MVRCRDARASGLVGDARRELDNWHRQPADRAPLAATAVIGLDREVREAAGVEAGDTVPVILALDTEERTVEVPEDLATALAGDAEAKAAFDGLAYTHRKEFARWVGEAKREETRERRAAQALEMLREWRTRS